MAESDTSHYDVAVVGAGVVGAAISSRLSFDDLRVLWLESSHDVGEGASKGNSAITASGFDIHPGTLEAELVRRSSPRWETIAQELDVPFRRIGSLALAFDGQEENLDALVRQVHANDVDAEVLSQKEVQRVAPAASRQAFGGLHIPAEGIIDSLRLTVAFAEVAVRNGTDLRLNTRVFGFDKDMSGAINRVRTTRGSFSVRYVVNASGLFADHVSRAAGAEAFDVWPRKGQFLVLNRDFGRRVNKILAPLPTERTRGILVVPTTNGSVLLGPTATDETDKYDTTTDRSTLEHVFREASRLVDGLSWTDVIKTFAGLRPASITTYRIGQSELVPNFVHACAIRSTGVSAAPAVADLVRGILEDSGLEIHPRDHATRSLPNIPRLLDLDAAKAISLTRRDDRYRLVVCACEHVTAAEIDAALHGSVPPTTIEGIRKRTRATGGRCQGAYCMAGVAFMLSSAQECAPWAVLQGEPPSPWGNGEA